jgi:hypothetical protein
MKFAHIVSNSAILITLVAIILNHQYNLVIHVIAKFVTRVSTTTTSAQNTSFAPNTLITNLIVYEFCFLLFKKDAGTGWCPLKEVGGVVEVGEFDGNMSTGVEVDLVYCSEMFDAAVGDLVTIADIDNICVAEVIQALIGNVAELDFDEFEFL